MTLIAWQAISILVSFFVVICVGAGTDSPIADFAIPTLVIIATIIMLILNTLFIIFHLHDHNHTGWLALIF